MTNASLPKSAAAEDLTFEAALALLAERAAAGPSPKAARKKARGQAAAAKAAEPKEKATKKKAAKKKAAAKGAKKKKVAAKKAGSDDLGVPSAPDDDAPF